jgi:endo-1,4-beta-xylanase
LGQLAATGLPIYISEMDLGNLNDSGTPNDGTQLQLYQKIFPILWQYPGVKGITLWGYVQGLTWQTTVYLVRSDGTARPALLWLANYVKNNPLGVEQTASKLPTNFQLEQNYPNPFNPTTNIDFSLPKNGYITLKVYNILGQEVATLFQGFHKAGAYKVNFNASQLASGVYIYRLQSENVSISKKLVLVK